MPGHTVRYMCLFLLLLCAGCKQTHIVRERLFVQTGTDLSQADRCLIGRSEYITVWVHGTRLVPRPLFKNFFYAQDGLLKATQFDQKYHVRSVADALVSADPTNYAADNLYIFGWSGALGFEKRKQAAETLYDQLCRVVKEYEQQHGQSPKIRIITHSHGGNVALNLAAIKGAQQLVVDELILLACPVQAETAPLIKSNIFKQIFVLYSGCDLIQVIDPQGLYPHNDHRPLLSERRFPYQDNIVQTKIKLNGRALMHIDFIRTKFVRMLPTIIEKMRSMTDQCVQESETCRTDLVLSIHTRTSRKRRCVSDTELCRKR